MKKKVCLGFCVLFITASMAAASTPELVSVKMIWDKAKYNSFTDLTRFKGKWYCTFRESDAHEGKTPGMVRVIVSVDGEKWESTGLFAAGTRDLRDPKISVTSDNRLMVRTEACLYRDRKDGKGREQVTRDSRASFSKDGIDWTPLEIQTFNCPGEHKTDGHRQWRVTWHKGKAYGVTALVRPNRTILVTSTDGMHWEQVTRFKFPKASWGDVNPSETTVRILHDDVMLALVRQTMLGTSRPPYTKWDWHEIAYAKDHPKPTRPHVCTIGGPDFIELPDGSLWGSGRQYHRIEGGSDKRTVLAEMTRTHYEPVLDIPSKGDSSYAGMVWNSDDNMLWMSYYSEHQGGPGSGPKIFLARIKFNQ